MATDSLVMELKDSGKSLLATLRQSEFNVTAAAWLRVSREDKWIFYVASNFVHSRGPTEAYRELYAALASNSDSLLFMEDIRLIRTDDPVTLAILALRRKTPANMPINFGGRKLGGVTIDAAYIYPV